MDGIREGIDVRWGWPEVGKGGEHGGAAIISNGGKRDRGAEGNIARDAEDDVQSRVSALFTVPSILRVAPSWRCDYKIASHLRVWCPVDMMGD